MSGLDDLARWWSEAQRVVVLTGAGLSTASGIPDFRSPGGRWSSYQPVPIQDFLASEASRRKYWTYKGETWQVIRAAEPNAAHVALAELGSAGHIELLVTQNTDGLHKRSGFPTDHLVAIHGSDARVVCMECGERKAREVAQHAWEAGEAVPRCSCGGPWKPDTISFGQSLIQQDLERAMESAAASDLFVAIGTSLVVGPINGMFGAACGNRARTAILTASDTPFDDVCHVRSTEPVEEILPRIAASMTRSS